MIHTALFFYIHSTLVNKSSTLLLVATVYKIVIHHFEVNSTNETFDIASET